MAKYLENVNAKHAELEKVEKLQRETEAHKAESYERIKKKFKDDLSSVFSKIDAELQSARFENDLKITASIVHDCVDKWCEMIDKMRKEESI